MIRAVIFDLDGVIIDAAPWHYEALVKALGVFGYSISDTDHEKDFNGLPTREKLQLLSARAGFPKQLHSLVSDLKQRYTEEILEKNCQPKAALRELLAELKLRGYKVGLASNSRRSTVDFVLKRMGITHFFDAVLSHEEALKAKPAPDLYLLACRRLAVAPEETLVIEDSPIGVQSAQSAGTLVWQVDHCDEVQWNNLEPFLSDLLTIEKKTLVRVPKLLQILIPMAGEGSRFREAGYQEPKPFIPVFGKPMIQWVVENLAPKHHAYRFLFLCQQNQLKENGRHPLLDKVSPGCALVGVPSVTQGAACTTLLASDVLDPEEPLLIANSDQWVEGGIEPFLEFCQDSGCDGAMLTFTSDNPKWSYARCDASGKVVEVKEKDPISPNATVGVYYFRRAGAYLTAATEMILANKRTRGEFYVCPVFNELIQKGKQIRIFNIPNTSMHGLGTPEDLSQFLSSPRG